MHITIASLDGIQNLCLGAWINSIRAYSRFYVDRYISRFMSYPFLVCFSPEPNKWGSLMEQPITVSPPASQLYLQQPTALKPYNVVNSTS